MNKSFKNLMQNIGLVTAAVATVAIQGCADGTSHVQGIDSPSITTTTVSGTAVKGVVANADCIVYAADQTTVLYTSVGNTDPCTDANGDYSVELDSEPTGAVIVQLLARTGTTMTCDFPDGCGNGVAFGGSLSLGSSFSMRAVVPSITGTTVEVNVTPWSEVAAARAISQAGSGNAITAAQVESATLETAAVLNNLLGLEGSSDAFGAELLSIDPVNLASPSSVGSDEDKKGSLLSLASSALFDLIDTGSNTSIEAVVTNLGAAFTDGEFNVNDTATNIASDSGIDLADVLTGISEVATELSTVLTSDATTTLNTLLGSDTDLTQVATEAESFASEKNSVTDQEADPTKPQFIDNTSTAVDKTRQLAVDLENVLTSGAAAFADFDNENNTTTIFEDLDTIFAIATTDVVDEIENLTDLIEAANEMILSVRTESTSELTDVGCTAGTGTISCTLAQAANLVENDFTALSMGTGSLSIDTNSYLVTDSNLLIGNNKYLLEVESTTFSLTGTILSTLTEAAIDLGNNNTNDISLGTTSTVSSPISSMEATSFTLDGNDLSISLPEYSFAGNVLLTRDLAFRDTVLSSFEFDGLFTILRTNDTVTKNQGSTANALLSFTTSTSSVGTTTASEPGSIPTFEEGPEETTGSFYTVNNAVFSTSVPVTYQKATLSSEQLSKDAATETLSVRITGDRTALGVTDLGMRYSLAGGGETRSLAGTVSIDDDNDTETYTLSNGSASVVITVTDAGLAGALTVDGTASGSITSLGAVTVTGSSQALQLATWALFQ